MSDVKKKNDGRKMGFKKGDRVLCWCPAMGFSKGKEYTVVDEYNDYNDYHLRLEGTTSGPFASRFELVVEEFETKDLDWGNCDPIITSHLNKGKAVKVLCFEYKSDKKGVEDFIKDYVTGSTWPYKGYSNTYQRVEKIVKEPTKVEITIDGNTTMISKECANSLKKLFTESN